MKPSISYLIFTHNEGARYINPLITRVLQYCDEEDEVIVIDDNSTEAETLSILAEFSEKIKIHRHSLDSNFAEHKNFGASKCDKDVICSFDADEMPTESLLSTLKEVILMNPTIDVYFLPRINIVQGLTQEDIDKWGWQIKLYKNARIINYPDPQGRIWKNAPHIKWVNKVHEVLSGQNSHTVLPAFDADGEIVADYALLHVKDIDRQRKQNDFYEKI